MRIKYFAGIIIFGLIAGGAILYKKCTQAPHSGSIITLKGFIGGEKINFLENEKIKRILKRKYGIILDYTKMGSIDMVKKNLNSPDFLWPSSQVALEIYKTLHPNQSVKAEIIFNSPIVFYSWELITSAFLKKRIIEKKQNTYIADIIKVISLILEGKKWKDVGLNDLYGKISIFSTDPARSNSGNMFSGLLANVLNSGEVVEENKIQAILPRIINFFKRLGYMESSSHDIFEQYLRMGEGAKPIIVGYENQVIEFSVQNPEVWNKLKQRVRIIYPVPTVWSSHPLIALTDKSKRLLEALKDTDIQRIAWKEHGFRTQMVSSEEINSLNIEGIPEQINKVIPMPGPKVMDVIIQTLGSETLPQNN